MKTKCFFKTLAGTMVALLLLTSVADAAEWQWSVVTKSGKPTNGVARAFLWVPPGCDRIRGVVVAQHNMEEISILENPIFRKALVELQFAEVWVAPMFDHRFDFTKGAGETFDSFMNQLAEESGYTELKYVPVAPIGHSAAASWPYYFAVWNPQRALCALSVSGQWPYVRDNFAAPDIWGTRQLDFIPCLESMGEYEAADTWSREGLRERQKYPHLVLSMLANPGQGHFAATDVRVEYLAFYLKKCVEYRVPKNWDGKSAAVLIPIDPTKTGWLKEKWLRDKAPTVASAPVGQYKGNPAEAFWFFDEATVRATEEYEAKYRGYKPQLVGIMQDGQMVPQTETHLQLTPKFQPEADGVSFKLTGAFYDRVPSGSSRLPNWTQLPTNAPLGHADAGRISIDPISGPIKKISADTFAVDFKRETLLVTNAARYELVFAVTHPGDSEYKPAVQQAHLYVPAVTKHGKTQQISFPEIPDQKVGAKPLKLKATSDSGLPVRYFVREGPAEVEGDTLRFTAIPPRARFPVKVTVAAWQYGRANEPKVQSATPVERDFVILK